MTLASAVLLVYAWLPGAAGHDGGSALLGLALGAVQPMIMSTLHQAAPPDRQGQALALRMIFTNVATIAMPAGFGLLAAVAGSAAPMWLMAGSAGRGALAGAADQAAAIRTGCRTGLSRCSAGAAAGGGAAPFRRRWRRPAFRSAAPPAAAA